MPNRLATTKLHALHKSLGARMAPYAGYDMPIQFKKGIVAEHLHTRTNCGLFDVSHMGQCKFVGKDREAFLEWMTPVDLQSIGVGEAQLSFIPNATGGIKDDCIISRYDDYDWLVCNAANKIKIRKHIEKLLVDFHMADPNRDVGLEVPDRHLIALQGPKSIDVVTKFIKGVDFDNMKFMDTRKGEVDGTEIQIGRCGYTGEDGFEISIPSHAVEGIVNMLLWDQSVNMIGLGARDTLRTEAGMCLYGHELGEDINPIQAKLMWCISKRRIAEGGFIGHDAIMDLRKDPKVLVPRLRVGIVSPSPVARNGAKISDPTTGEEIGMVTSGLRSPSLNKNVQQAYVNRTHTAKGSKVLLHVGRNQTVEGEVTPFPFVKTNYFRK